MSAAEGSAQESERIAREFLDALSSGKAERILALYDDDVRVWTAGSLPFSGTHDRAEIAALCEGLLGAFPEGLVFRMTGLTAQRDRIAIEAEGRGVHASGRLYEQRYHFLLVHRGGKIVEMKEYFDTELAREVLCASPGGE